MKCNKKNECMYAMNACSRKNEKDFKICGYILQTGNPRGCPADQCDKFKPKLSIRKPKSIPRIIGGK